MAVRAARFALWALVALGAIGGLAATMRPRPPGFSAAAADSDEAPPPIAGFANLAVQRWLATGELLRATPTSASPRPDDRSAINPLPVTSTDPVASRRLGDGYWAVTVAVQVPQGEAAAALWFVEVGVVESADGLAATGPPAVVPSPLHSGAPAPAGRALSVPAPGDPIAAATQAFLDALLAGKGDVSRYLAPGADLAAVTPAFDSARVTRIAEVAVRPAHAVIRVEAVATTAGIDLPLVYELTLLQRAGRWEVRHLSGAPTLRRPPSAPLRPTTTTATASPTTTTAPAVPGA